MRPTRHVYGLRDTCMSPFLSILGARVARVFVYSRRYYRRLPAPVTAAFAQVRLPILRDGLGGDHVQPRAHPLYA